MALIEGLPARDELKAGFELDGAFGLLVVADELSSGASSFLENIFENGFANAGFFMGSASAGASSLWQLPIDEEKQKDKQAIANKMVFKMLFDRHISLSPSEHKSSYKIS